MKKETLSQRCSQQLYNMIAVERSLSPGDKLPNEVELASQLGVSRTTLREAIRDLITQGALVVHRGRGTFVAPQADQLNDFGFSRLNGLRGQLGDLFELRSIFEPKAARLACRRACAQERAEILTLGAQVAQCILTGQDRTQADRAFHAAIVRATHNEFMMRLLPMINQAVEGAICTDSDQESLARITLQDHALLLDFFRKGDEVGAEYAMAIHMHHAMDEMGLVRE